MRHATDSSKSALLVSFAETSLLNSTSREEREREEERETHETRTRPDARQKKAADVT